MAGYNLDNYTRALDPFRSRNSGGAASDPPEKESPIAGLVPKLIGKIAGRRRYKPGMGQQAADPNDTGVPDYMSPQGEDPYDSKYGNY